MAKIVPPDILLVSFKRETNEVWRSRNFLIVTKTLRSFLFLKKYSAFSQLLTLIIGYLKTLNGKFKSCTKWFHRRLDCIPVWFDWNLLVYSSFVTLKMHRQEHFLLTILTVNVNVFYKQGFSPGQTSAIELLCWCSQNLRTFPIILLALKCLSKQLN